MRKLGWSDVNEPRDTCLLLCTDACTFLTREKRQRGAEEERSGSFTIQATPFILAFFETDQLF